MSLTATDLREAIHEAFDSAALPEHVDDLLLEPYRSSIDATEMAADFAGRSWAAIPIQELFSHRQMLSTMSAVAYRAYIAAYLLACVNEDPSASRYVGDIWEYTVLSLKAWRGQEPTSAALVKERLSLLNAPQRDAIRSVLRSIAASSQRDEVRTLLAEW